MLAVRSKRVQLDACSRIERVQLDACKRIEAATWTRAGCSEWCCGMLDFKLSQQFIPSQTTIFLSKTKNKYKMPIHMSKLNQNKQIKCQAGILSFIRPRGQPGRQVLWELFGPPCIFRLTRLCRNNGPFSSFRWVF